MTELGLVWLEVEVPVDESVVVLAVVPVAAVTVIWVPAAVVVVWMASLFVAVVVVSWFSLLSRVASTSRSPNPTTGAANDTRQRNNRTKVRSEYHRILTTISQDKRRERMRISRDGGAVRSDYMSPASLVRRTNMHMHYNRVGEGRVAEPKREAGLFIGSSL